MDETGYALYLIDVFGNKELIYRDPEISCFMPIPLRPRPRPPILPDTTDPDQTVRRLHAQRRGVRLRRASIRKQVRYLRISHRLPWPYDERYGGLRYENVALSEGLSWTPVEVLGTVPVEADGSAHFRVPVDTPVYFQLLDENFMELRRMRSFISFQPGETARLRRLPRIEGRRADAEAGAVGVRCASRRSPRRRPGACGR